MVAMAESNTKPPLNSTECTSVVHVTKVTTIISCLTAARPE
jgi:hypothetical protein